MEKINKFWISNREEIKLIAEGIGEDEPATGRSEGAFQMLRGGKELLIVLIDTSGRVHERRKRARRGSGGKSEKERWEIKTATYVERFSFGTSWKATWHSGERRCRWSRWLPVLTDASSAGLTRENSPARRVERKKGGGERGSRCRKSTGVPSFRI